MVSVCSCERTFFQSLLVTLHSLLPYKIKNKGSNFIHFKFDSNTHHHCWLNLHWNSYFPCPNHDFCCLNLKVSWSKSKFCWVKFTNFLSKSGKPTIHLPFFPGNSSVFPALSARAPSRPWRPAAAARGPSAPPPAWRWRWRANRPPRSPGLWPLVLTGRWWLMMVRPITHMLHVWYIYLQNWVIFRVHVGKYSFHTWSIWVMATIN